MKTVLSHNEITILDHQVATLYCQLSELAGSLESRLGKSDELATSARTAQQEFASFVQRVRRTAALQPDTEQKSNSQIA